MKRVRKGKVKDTKSELDIESGEVKG